MNPLAILCVVLFICVTGCSSHPSAVDRLRGHFHIPASIELSPQNIRSAILQQLPLGTPEKEILAWLQKNKIGKDPLSSFYQKDKDNQIVCRIEYDSQSLDIVKESWSVIFTVNNAGRLAEITSKKWLTGP
jgi:hypothetical protein